VEGTGGIFCCLLIVVAVVLVGVLHDSDTKAKQAKEKAAEEEREAEQRALEAQERAVVEQRLWEPSGYAAELDARLRAGDEAAVLLLLARLPAWPIRGALDLTTRRLMAFWRGAHLAVGASVFGEQVTVRLTEIITSTGEFVRHVAVKLMTLSGQAGPVWQRLPGAARQHIEHDHRVLNGICVSLDQAQHSMTIAIAAGRRANQRAESDVIDKLHGLSEMLRERPGPYI
jgi:hypothetical protein